MDVKLINRTKEGELVLTGKLDNNTAPELEEIINQVADRFPTLILNCQDLSYISSAGLRVLKVAYMQTQAAGNALVVRNVRDSIKEILEMTGFMGVLNIE